ncbi:hypothetical protein Tco_0966645 [Tanacetum coccineum]
MVSQDHVLDLFAYTLHQVEKAFREGTARQNAHSMFVSFALKLLEECVSRGKISLLWKIRLNSLKKKRKKSAMKNGRSEEGQKEKKKTPSKRETE